MNGQRFDSSRNVCQTHSVRSRSRVRWQRSVLTHQTSEQDLPLSRTMLVSVAFFILFLSVLS